MPKAKVGLMHKILIIDAELQNALPSVDYHAFVENLAVEMMYVLDMKPLGPIGIFEALDDTEPGWSFIQPITTSHISAHYFSKPDPKPHIHIDIYSCKNFDANAATKKLASLLGFGKTASSVLNRTMTRERKAVSKLEDFSKKPIIKKR
jgi:S-adenosylmethionine/arginine decarboxylase-like enzyme